MSAPCPSPRIRATGYARGRSPTSGHGRRGRRADSLSTGSAAEDRDAGHGFLDAVDAAAVLGDGHARAVHLARARLAAQLRDELVNLPEARGADGMTL